MKVQLELNMIEDECEANIEAIYTPVKKIKTVRCVKQSKAYRTELRHAQKNLARLGRRSR